MPWYTDLCNTAVDAAAADCGFVSGWGVDGETPVELTSRETVTWAAAADETASASNQPVLDVAGAGVLYFIGVFPASSGGFETISASYDFETPVEFTEAGTYTLTAMALTVTNP